MRYMFPWTICQKDFKVKQKLARHMPSCARGVMRRRAREDAEFTCKIRKKSFASKEVLCQHIIRHSF